MSSRSSIEISVEIRMTKDVPRGEAIAELKNLLINMVEIWWWNCENELNQQNNQKVNPKGRRADPRE